MNKTEVCQYLEDKGIPFEKIAHPAVYDMEQLAALNLPHPEWDAKNLFVRDDKKRNYYLITVKGDKRVDLKVFRTQHGLRSLSFASEAELESFLHLTPGAVTPLGLLNDAECRVRFYLDAEFSGSKIAVHPNDNTATLWLEADELMQLLREHGNWAQYTQI